MSGSPWMRFYPADWRSDPALRMCSIGARGLWMEMLCIMHEAMPFGSLLVNGRAVSTLQLAGLAGIAPKQAAALLGELEAAGVFSRDDDGTIYSRRMRRDAEKAERDKANGKTGGHPLLKPPDKPPDTRGLTGGVNPQKPEARSQKPELAQQVLDSEPRGPADLDRIESLCRQAAGLENDPSPGFFDLSPILGLLDRGFSIDLILTVLKSRKGRGKPRGWRYFVSAIEEAAEASTGPPAGSNGHAEPVAGTGSCAVTMTEWRKRRKFMARLTEIPELAWGNAESWPAEVLAWPETAHLRRAHAKTTGVGWYPGIDDEPLPDLPHAPS